MRGGRILSFSLFADLLYERCADEAKLRVHISRWVERHATNARAFVKHSWLGISEPDRDDAFLAKPRFKLVGFKLRPYFFWKMLAQERDHISRLRPINRSEISFHVVSKYSMLLITIVKDLHLLLNQQIAQLLRN